MERPFQELLKRLDHVSGQVQELQQGVHMAVDIAPRDPEMALTRTRKVLEYVIRDVYERRIKEAPGTRPLENLQQRLVKDGHFPLVLDAYANTVRMLGNVATHRFGEKVSVADVYQSLTQLLPILEWYSEVERPEALGRKPASASWQDSTPADIMPEARPLDVTGTEPPRLAAGLPALLERLEAIAVVLPRDDLLTEALRRLQQGPLPVLVLQGLTGIGKTLLMARIARKAAPEYQHVLVLALDGPAAVEPAYVLEEVNQFLAGLGRGLAPEQLTRDKPERILALLGGRLSELGARVLVLLDAADAAVPTWLDALLRCLAKPPQVRLLATARTRLSGFGEAHLAVPPLSDGEALALVSEYRRVFHLDIDPATVLRRLPPGIRSHPQALVTLLAQLSDFPLEGLLDWGLPDEVQTPGRLIRQVVAGLEPAARQALALARMLSGLDLFQAARLLRLTPLPALPDLKTLLSRSLLYRVSEAGYVYVVPAIVGETLAVEDPAVMAAAAAQVAAGWKQALAADAAPLETLAPLGVRVAHNLTVCARLDLVHGLAPETFLERLNVRGLWKEYSLLLGLELEAARAAGDRHGCVALGLRLTRKLAQTGDPDEARQALAEAEALADQGSLMEQAELHSHRALLCGLRRDDAGALNEYQESRRLHIEAGDGARRAAVETQLGKLYLMRRDLPAARAAFAATHELLAAEPLAKPRLEAAISLAVCDLWDGNLEAAERALRAVLATCVAAGYEAGRARARLNLALTLERLGRMAEALELARLVVGETDSKEFAVVRTAEMVMARLELVCNPKKEATR